MPKLRDLLDALPLDASDKVPIGQLDGGLAITRGATLANVAAFLATKLGPSQPPDEKFEVAFDSPSYRVIGNVAAGAAIEAVRVLVLEAFAPGATLTFGTSAHPSLFLGAADADLSVQGQYDAVGGIPVDASDVLVTSVVLAGSSAGRARVTFRRI